MAAKLIEKGFKVYIIDNLSTGSKINLPKKSIFYFYDICDVSKINYLFSEIKFDHVGFPTTNDLVPSIGSIIQE